MEDCLARRASTRSCSSGTSSTEAGCGIVGDPSIWTSGSFGSRFGRFSSGAGALGFDSFGSFPSFSAFTIRTAFHFAYLIFDCVSASGGPQMFTSSRKVAAAWNVSAVCLQDVRPFPRHNWGAKLCDLICLHCSICPLKCLQSKLLYICLASCVVHYGIIRSIVCFDLELLSVCDARVTVACLPVLACPSRSSCTARSRCRHCADPSTESD
jgi:hypothetical protein